MKKSARQRKRLQLQKQQQQQKQQRQYHKSDAKRVQPVKRDEVDDAIVNKVMPGVVRASDTPTRIEYISADSIEARDRVETSTTTSSTAAVTNPLEQHPPLLYDIVPGIEINGKSGIVASNNDNHSSPQKRVTVSKASVRKQGHSHKKKENSNRSRAKLLSAYESIIFSESQIPVFLRRQDDFRQTKFRLKEGSNPETNAKSQKKNSHGLRHDDSHKKKRDQLSSGTSNKKKNNKEDKVGVVVTLSPFLDISGVNINAEVKDELEHNTNTNVIDKNSNIDSLNRNPISEISDPDPKITRDDALFIVEGQRERSGGKTMVAQGHDPVMSRRTFPCPPEQQRYSWEQQGVERASGRALERHRQIRQGHHGLPPSEPFLPACGFDATAAWILLLGLVVSAIIVKKVFYVPRQRRQSTPSTNVERLKDPAQVLQMKDHSVYSTE